MFEESGNRRWGARLCVRTGAGAEAIGRVGNPDDAGLPALEADGLRDLRDIDRCAGMEHAADRTAAIVRAMPGLVALAGGGIGIAVTDHGRGDRIGGRDAGRPARADRCENLHHQGDQDYR